MVSLLGEAIGNESGGEKRSVLSMERALCLANISLPPQASAKQTG
jgi:hypothetical protein